MAAGSIIGATLGGLAVAYAPVAFLKVLLGCVLLAAAGKTAFAISNCVSVLFVALHMVEIGTKLPIAALRHHGRY